MPTFRGYLTNRVVPLCQAGGLSPEALELQLAIYLSLCHS
jgi:hypothetical protein